MLSLSINRGLVHAISRVFTQGTLPTWAKESTTLALYKEGKLDYTLLSVY